jgi:ADP-ribose pyrophosphatase
VSTAAAPAEPAGYRLLSSREVFTGAIFSVFTDEVELPDGTVVLRDWVRNRGAVVVVALDDAGRVALIRQYRHAVRSVLWELPAGLLDVADEAPVAAAARELAEEVDLVAGRWNHLVDEHASPGFANELVHIYLARELSDVPDSHRHVRDQEEAQLEVRMVELDDAVAMVLRGEITNAAAVIGLLAAARARDQGWAGLRPA